MHLPAVANLSNNYPANIIAGTREMHTRFYPYFGRKGMCNASPKVGVKLYDNVLTNYRSCGYIQQYTKNRNK